MFYGHLRMTILDKVCVHLQWEAIDSYSPNFNDLASHVADNFLPLYIHCMYFAYF